MEAGNVAVIGNQFPAMSHMEIEAMATTGQFGLVSSCKEKVEMKRGHAAEIDFVFKKTADNLPRLKGKGFYRAKARLEGDFGDNGAEYLENPGSSERPDCKRMDRSHRRKLMWSE